MRKLKYIEQVPGEFPDIDVFNFMIACLNGDELMANAIVNHGLDADAFMQMLSTSMTLLTDVLNHLSDDDKERFVKHFRKLTNATLHVDHDHDVKVIFG